MQEKTAPNVQMRGKFLLKKQTLATMLPVPKVGITLTISILNHNFEMGFTDI